MRRRGRGEGEERRGWRSRRDKQMFATIWQTPIVPGLGSSVVNFARCPEFASHNVKKQSWYWISEVLPPPLLEHAVYGTEIVLV